MSESADLLRRAARELRSPISRYFDRVSKDALAAVLDLEAARVDSGGVPTAGNRTMALARAILREPDSGGEAAREAPPNDLSTWRVRHPGIGVLTYPDETSARAAAGTAGVVYPPGEPHRDTS